MKHIDYCISPELLNGLFPLDYLTDNERELLCSKTPKMRARIGEQLIKMGSTDDRAIYLLKGKLKLKAKDGHSHVISAGSEDAKRAISHLVPHWYTVTCSSPTAEFFWIDNFVLENLLQRQNPGGEQVQDLDIDSSLFRHKLFQRIYHDLSEDKLALPTLPEVLTHIMSLVEDHNQLKNLTGIVSADPAISAAVVKIANSAVYRKSEIVDTVKDAVELIGVDELKEILLNNVTRSLHYSYSPEIVTRIEAVWWHSAETAAIAYALAKLLKTFDPKRAMLMGLLHDIGMLPIYYYADRYPELLDKHQGIGNLVKQLHGDLGALILANWKFPPEFIKVSIDADNWHYHTTQENDYSDLIMIAHLHSFIGKSDEKRLLAIPDEHLPHIIELPAYQRLGIANLTAEDSMWLLNTARNKLNSLKAIWGLKEAWGTDSWRKAHCA